jgi:hypothetical protein
VEPFLKREQQMLSAAGESFAQNPAKLRSKSKDLVLAHITTIAIAVWIAIHTSPINESLEARRSIAEAVIMKVSPCHQKNLRLAAMVMLIGTRRLATEKINDI